MHAALFIDDLHEPNWDVAVDRAAWYFSIDEPHRSRLAMYTELLRVRRQGEQIRPRYLSAQLLAYIEEHLFDPTLSVNRLKRVCGVRDGWLIMGSHPRAVTMTLATAAGEHPSVRANEALRSAALLPDGPVGSVSFTDHRGDAEEVAAVVGLAVLAPSLYRNWAVEGRLAMRVEDALRLGRRRGVLQGPAVNKGPRGRSGAPFPGALSA